jgi:flagellar secretion chaperone FliS
MNLANPWKSYRQVATQTASPGQLVLMLYDGAIRFLERSLTGFSIEDPAESNQTINNNVIRAQEIVNELNYSLDMEKGGEIAVQLRQLYVYFDRRLMESNIHKSPEGIREVIARLTTLRDAWSTMLANRENSQAEVPGRLPEFAMA